MNDNLKVIAEMLGFTREISKMQFCGKERVEDTERLCDMIGTLSARRTFEDYDTMKHYIALTDKTRKNMKRVKNVVTWLISGYFITLFV